MKTPEEIKNGLAGCKDKSQCEWCILVDQCKKNADALAYIRQLEAGIDHAEKVARECAKYITENLDKLQAKLIQVERERDAAADCIQKVYSELVKPAETITSIRLNATYAIYDMIDYFRNWRGVCPENTKEE
jgi:hypothetical protein